MATWGNWFESSWFSLIQSIGIVSGLCFTAVTLRREGRSREVAHQLSLLEQHRELWSELHRRRDLDRVMDPEADMDTQPITPAEENFLMLVLAHFETGWKLSQTGVGASEEILRSDVRQMLCFPLPRLVWNRTLRIRNKAFVSFVGELGPVKRSQMRPSSE